MSDLHVTWREAETILKLSEVKTIQEFFQHLSEEATQEVYRKGYADAAQGGETVFTTLEEYLHVRYSQAKYPDKVLTPESVREMLAEDIVWKNQQKTPVDDIKLVYYESFHRRTKAERMIHWDTMTSVKVFTDDDGVILGWRIRK